MKISPQKMQLICWQNGTLTKRRGTTFSFFFINFLSSIFPPFFTILIKDFLASASKEMDLTPKKVLQTPAGRN